MFLVGDAFDFNYQRKDAILAYWIFLSNFVFQFELQHWYIILLNLDAAGVLRQEAFYEMPDLSLLLYLNRDSLRTNSL